MYLFILERSLLNVKFVEAHLECSRIYADMRNVVTLQTEMSTAESMPTSKEKSPYKVFCQSCKLHSGTTRIRIEKIASYLFLIEMN